jgi:hypothetical protein
MRRPELIFQHSASADGFDVGIGSRKHKRGAGVAPRADRAEHISVGIALILGLVLEGGPNSRLVCGCCSLFHAVLTQRETAKLLIGIGNYAAVSPFRGFREWANGNLNPRIRRFLAQFKLRRLFTQNREMAKHRQVSAENTVTYLLQPFWKQPATVSNRDPIRPTRIDA